MRTFVKKYPALSLLLTAMMLGWAPLLAVNVGLLPEGYSQLGALSAGLAGLILAAVEGGRRGLYELLRRFLIWRVGVQWWAFALFFAVVPSVASLYLFDLLGGPRVDWSGLKPLYTVIPTILILTVLAGVGEEFGWRGFALPRLQQRHSALASGLIVGVIWSIWHIPLFLTKGTSQNEWFVQAGAIPSILGYSLFVIAGSVQSTWVFNNTKGSVLLQAVLHGAGNAWVGEYINVYRGYFGGILSFMAIEVLISVIVVLVTGATNLSRRHARNVLIPDANSAGEPIAEAAVAPGM